MTRLALRCGLGLVLSLGALGCSGANTATDASPDDATSATAVAAEESTDSLRTVSDDPVAQRVFELGTRDSKVQDHLRYLTKEIGHRLTSSHNLMVAERWCRDQFSAMGLEARLESWGEFPVGFDRGPQSGRVEGESGDLAKLEFTTRAWTPGVFGPHVGEAVSYPETLGELRGLKGKLEGAWVLRPRWRSGGPAKKLREKIDAALRKAGIAGQVVRTGGKEGELVHTGGRYKVSWDELTSDVSIYLRGSQYDEIEKRVEAGTATRLEFSVDNRFFQGPVPQNNVVAEIPGSELPGEYVIVGGHLDSWDGAEGAVDNGTGVATTLEAARLLVAAGAKPRRTIRFMLWSGEEQGLLGSKGYVADHPDEMEHVSAVLVHDGGTNYLSGLRITPEMRAQMEVAFAPVMKLDPKMPFELEEVDSLKPGGSDHSPFIAVGVPGFFWNQAGESDYDHMHHTQFDTFATAVPDYQRHSAMVVALGAYGLANLDAKVDRTNSSPLPRRRLGVGLDGLVVTEIGKKSKAKSAGWKVGDEILAVDGEKVEGRRQLGKRLQVGDPKKTVRIRRGAKELDTVLDYSGDPGEAERAARQKARAAAGSSPKPNSQPVAASAEAKPEK